MSRLECAIIVGIMCFAAIRCQWSGAVEEMKSSNVAEIIVETVGFRLNYYFRQISRQVVFLARNLGKRTSAVFADFWRRPATRDDFISSTAPDHWYLIAA
jgi:hypothetical protein